jgi:hypothetical protein
MKVFDLIGNELKKGDTVFFEPIKGLVTVGDIVEPGRIDESAPGCLTLEFKMPIKLEKGKGDVRFGDLMHVHVPEESVKVEQQIAEIMQGKPKHTLKLAKKA